jgi:glycosyltransferase involved in cell wall biosynthesis
LLQELARLDTGGVFTYSIVITENDPEQSSRSLVSAFAATSPVPVKYCFEPRQSIALARNTAIANASGDFVAFIDDDEFPTDRWLLELLNACERHGVAGVLGPVLPHFADGAPRWVIDGKFYDRPLHPTGVQLDWQQTRTGNVLIKSNIFEGADPSFNPQCLEGSDQEFFKRMMQNGHRFIWCNEAVVYEVVPPERWKRNFLIRRALQRGFFSLRNHGVHLRPVMQSLVAVPAYSAALPVALALGQAKFMSCVFRLSYHSGRLLALLGLNPIFKVYVSQ